MTAPVARIHAHVCAYSLFVAGRWVSASSCCYGTPLPIDPPGLKSPAWPITAAYVRPVPKEEA